MWHMRWCLYMDRWKTCHSTYWSIFRTHSRNIASLGMYLRGIFTHMWDKQQQAKIQEQTLCTPNIFYLHSSNNIGYNPLQCINSHHGSHLFFLRSTNLARRHSNCCCVVGVVSISYTGLLRSADDPEIMRRSDIFRLCIIKHDVMANLCNENIVKKYFWRMLSCLIIWSYWDMSLFLWEKSPISTMYYGRPLLINP